MPTTSNTKKQNNERSSSKLIVEIDDQTRDQLALLARHFACNLSVAVAYAINNVQHPTSANGGA